MSFEVGDRVVDLIQGEGVVVKREDTDYPIVVNMNSGHTATYTKDGKYLLGSMNPSLFHAGTKIIPAPEPERKSAYQFKPFDRVLVRISLKDIWEPDFFGKRCPGNPDNDGAFIYRTIGGEGWSSCIPYEGNEHLCGTTDSPEQQK